MAWITNRPIRNHPNRVEDHGVCPHPRSRSRQPEARAKFVVAVLMATAGSLSAWSQDFASSPRGEKALRSRDCLRCHSLAGEGAATAADLGRRSILEQHTPAEFAALLWNHGPDMWDGRSADLVDPPLLTATEADDMFAYFWGIRYFDRRGEAIRGKQVFSGKGCTDCHGLTADDGVAAGPAVSEWRGLGDPVQWAQRLWNHSGSMQELLESRGLEWPEFTEHEMIDLLLYLQNLTPKRQPPRRLVLSAPNAGRLVFDAKGCVNCHTLGPQTTAAGAREGGSLQGFNTMTGFTAQMWNHAPEMRDLGKGLGMDAAAFTTGEMRDLMSYLYFNGAFEERGSVRAGRTAYVKKQCESCHGQPGTGDGGPLKGPRASSARLAVAVWSHGPAMLEEMDRRGQQWPTLSARDVANLVAYLNDSER